MTKDTYASHLPTLDGWRAIAIGFVLLSHGFDSLQAALGGWLPPRGEGVESAGLLGVRLFFGLSGFLITSRLLAEESRYGAISLTGFYIRRSFRILPAALVFLGVIGLLAMAGVIDVSPGRWLASLFFLANYTSAEHSWYVAHFWSLAVEEHFYLLWPAAFLLLGSVRRRIPLVVAGVILLAVWRAIDFRFQLTGSSPAVFWGRSDIQADSILWGVLVALLWADRDWGPRLQRLVAAPLAAPLLLATLVVLECLPHGDWKLAFALISVKAAVIPLLLLATVLTPRGAPGRLLETAPLRWVGRLSYSLYLWQQLFLVWAAYQVPDLALLQSFPLNLVAVFACAALSLAFVETPLIALGGRLAKRWGTRRAAALLPAAYAGASSTRSKR